MKTTAQPIIKIKNLRVIYNQVCLRHLAENKKETACLVLVKIFALAECFIKKSETDSANTDNFTKDYR